MAMNKLPLDMHPTLRTPDSAGLMTGSSVSWSFKIEDRVIRLIERSKSLRQRTVVVTPVQSDDRLVSLCCWAVRHHRSASTTKLH